MARITKEHAEKIVKKLNAEVIRKRKAHDLAIIFFEGDLIAQFGLRRGSGWDAGHDHIPESLHISPHQALDLARCPLSFEGWIQLLREKGKV